MDTGAGAIASGIALQRHAAHPHPAALTDEELVLQVPGPSPIGLPGSGEKLSPARPQCSGLTRHGGSPSRRAGLGVGERLLGWGEFLPEEGAAAEAKASTCHPAHPLLTRVSPSVRAASPDHPFRSPDGP